MLRGRGTRASGAVAQSCGLGLLGRRLDGCREPRLGAAARNIDRRQFGHRTLLARQPLRARRQLLDIPEHLGELQVVEGLFLEQRERELVEHAGSAVSSALSEKVPAATQAILDTAARLKRVTDRLQHEQAALERRLRFLGAGTLGAIAVACLLLVAGTGYASWHNVQRAQRAHVDAEVLEALRHVTITACDGAPCIKLEEGLRRWEKNGEYVLVDGAAAGGSEPAGRR